MTTNLPLGVQDEGRLPVSQLGKKINNKTNFATNKPGFKSN